MEISDLLFSPIPEVQDLAGRAERYRVEYETGKISKTEYLDLLDDLISLKDINEEMISLEATRELWQIVSIIKNIKFATTLI